MSADELEGLMAKVRASVRAGDLATLSTLPDRIEAALARGLPGDAAGAGRLRALAEETAVLLQAALRGVRAARRRAAELQAPDRLSTYDASGRRDLSRAAPPPSRRV